MNNRSIDIRLAAPAVPNGGAREKQTRKLSDEQKTFVVLMLAAFESYADVADALRVHFGQTLEPLSIAYYDPECHKGRNLSRRWRDLFQMRRARVLEAVRNDKTQSCPRCGLNTRTLPGPSEDGVQSRDPGTMTDEERLHMIFDLLWKAKQRLREEARAGCDASHLGIPARDAEAT
jgi:hypothetical protein